MYIIASRQEGGPKALLESWACGVPVVTTRVGMCADAAIDGRDTVVVPQEDSNGLASGANRVFADSRFRKALLDGGHATVVEFGWDRIVARYMSDLYAPLVGIGVGGR